MRDVLRGLAATYFASSAIFTIAANLFGLWPENPNPAGLTGAILIGLGCIWLELRLRNE